VATGGVSSIIMGKLKKKVDSDFEDDEKDKPKKRGKFAGAIDKITNMNAFASMSGAMSPEKFTEMLDPRLKQYDENLQRTFKEIIGSQILLLDDKIKKLEGMTMDTLD